MEKSNRTWVLCVLVTVIGATAACADTDGRDPFALWKTFTHEDGVYTFRYLAPPWELWVDETASDPDTQIIAVEPMADDLNTSIETGSLQAKYKATVTLRPHTSAEAEARRDAARLSETTDGPVSSAPFENAYGQVGICLDARLPDRSIRAVYFDGFDSQTIVMQVAGRSSVAAADFTLLLEGLELEGAGE
jgi:hypothetical protein